MFKLTKYEFRKNIGVIVTIIAALFGVELFFLIGNVRDAAFAMVGGFFVLIFGGLAAYFTVFFLGISSYQKELSSKGSYLAFMTPNSSLKIICSKLLFTFSVGVIFLVIIAGFLSIDVEILGRKFDDEVSLIKLFISIANMSGYNVLEIAYALVALALDFLIVFFMVVSVAYFSITLSLTLLQSKKIKGFVSVVFFVVFIYIVVKVGSFLPVIYENPRNINQAIITYIPSMALYALAIVGNIWGCARLLDKHVSL